MMPAHQLDLIFAALSDPTRRAILARLAEEGEVSATALSAPFNISQPAISRHLKVLEDAGLISRSREAQKRPCRIEVVPLEAAGHWIETYCEVWESNFGRLDALMRDLKSQSDMPTRK